jgi:uncharacterized protein YecT (DUF1311 family)
MKPNFCILNFALAIGLGLSLASCGKSSTDPSISEPKQTKPPDASKQTKPPDASTSTIVAPTNTTAAIEPEICKTARTTSECKRAKLQLSEVELKQIFDRLIDEIGNVIPLERTQPLKIDISAAHKAWLGYRDKTCNLQVALSQTGRLAIRGSTLDAVRADCKAQMNHERIKETSKMIEEQKGRSLGGSTSNTPSATPTVFKVQSLSDGDHFFTSGEPPRYSGTFFLLRKQGNITIGWGGTHNSDGSCLKKVVLPDSRVETTTVTVSPGDRGEVKVDRDVSIGDGSFGNSELSKVDVDQYPNSAKRLQVCAKEFSN